MCASGGVLLNDQRQRNLSALMAILLISTTAAATNHKILSLGLARKAKIKCNVYRLYENTMKQLKNNV